VAVAPAHCGAITLGWEHANHGEPGPSTSWVCCVHSCTLWLSGGPPELLLLGCAKCAAAVMAHRQPRTSCQVGLTCCNSCNNSRACGGEGVEAVPLLLLPHAHPLPCFHSLGCKSVLFVHLGFSIQVCHTHSCTLILPAAAWLALCLVEHHSTASHCPSGCCVCVADSGEWLQCGTFCTWSDSVSN